MKKNEITLTEEQMRERAAEGYFIRDLEKDRVYCPTGEILRKKSIRHRIRRRYRKSKSHWN